MNGKTTSGIWTATNLAALAQLNCSQLDDGTPVWVQSERCTYTFLASSSLPADGFEVVVPIAGAPRAGNAGAQFVRAGGAAQHYSIVTTTASITPFTSITFPPNSTGQVELIINATSANGDHLALRSIFGFESNAAAVAEIGAGHVNIFDRRDGGAAVWDVGALVSGLTAQLAVAGEAGKTITWGITVITSIN